jgi:hypothetical protein
VLTRFADSRQVNMSPITRTVVPQLAHQGAVRKEHEIHMLGLALAVPQLTIAQVQMLFPVMVKGLGVGYELSYLCSRV